MLISLTNLAAMRKIQKNIWTKVRLVGLININTKEWRNKPPFMKVVYSGSFWMLQAPNLHFSNAVVNVWS